jgi:hypothetical protein
VGFERPVKMAGKGVEQAGWRSAKVWLAPVQWGKF